MIVKIASTVLDDGSRPGRIFVMDEPTAALTARECERLFQIIVELKRRGCAVIYVSHRIEEILQVCDRITVLRDGVSQAPIPSRDDARRADRTHDWTANLERPRSRGLPRRPTLA